MLASHSHDDRGILRSHLGTDASCSASSDLMWRSSSKRVSVSRRFPRLSTSLIVGMLKMPYCRANLFSHIRRNLFVSVRVPGSHRLGQRMDNRDARIADVLVRGESL